MTPADFIRLKEKIEKLNQQLHRATGSRDTLLQRLQDEFECSSLEEADGLLERLEQKEKKLTTKYSKQLSSFESKWNEKLEQVE